MRSSRRTFLKDMSVGVATLAGLGACSRLLPPPGSETVWEGVPPLDGELLRDAGSRELFGSDLGGNIRRLPAAVLRPRSPEDVMKTVRFANTHRLHVAMRGRGHSQYGQTLVEEGIVIDSASLNAVTVHAPDIVYAQAGASWDDVTHRTVAYGLTPPALGDTMSLSVGGILSAGGIGNTSHRFGAVVDNVAELDVVTGAGDLVTCSPDRNRELFDLTLGGMGQCALIVGARLRLVPSPAWVVRRDLQYSSLTTFLADLRAVATAGLADHVGALVTSRGAGGGWRFTINVGRFSATPDVDFAPIEAGLRFESRGEPVPLAYASYLHREDARNAALTSAARAAPMRMLSLTMFLPGSISEEFLTKLLARPGNTAGINRFSLYMLPTQKLNRPMLVLPREELTFTIFLLRNVPVAEQARYTEMVSTVRTLVAEMRDAGGKAYPPYAPFYSSSDWAAHYGPAAHRLAEGIRQFDPGNILTPGMRTV